MRPSTKGLPAVCHRVADSPEIVAVVTFLLIFVFFAARAKEFLSAYAISNFLTFGAVYGVLVIGVAFLMIAGEFDLSVGSNMAVAMYILVLLLLARVPPLIAMCAALVASAALGLINGLLVTNSRIPSFIVTLGSMLAYRGLARFLGKGNLINYSIKDRPVLFDLLNGYMYWPNDLFQPPANFRTSIFWFLALVILMTIVLTRSRFGNWVFASGGAPHAALAQGVPVKRVKLVCLVLSGLSAGFAGMLFFSHRLSVNPLTGYGSELLAVTAAVIGGVRLTGGYGAIVGAAVGVILLSMLEQGLTSMGIAQEVFEATTGLILILAMLVNTTLGGRGD